MSVWLCKSQRAQEESYSTKLLAIFSHAAPRLARYDPNVENLRFSLIRKECPVQMDSDFNSDITYPFSLGKFLGVRRSAHFRAEHVGGSQTREEPRSSPG